MYVLVLVAVLEGWILGDESLKELEQFSFEVRLAPESAALLLVAADNAKGCTVVLVACQPHVVLLNHLFHKVVLCVADHAQSQKVQQCVALTVR